MKLVWASPVSLVVKNLPASEGDARDAGLLPELGRSLGVGNGNTFQYSCLENSMDPLVTVHGLTKRQTRLNNGAHIHTWLMGDNLRA